MVFLVLIVLVQTIQIAGIKNKFSVIGNVASASGSIDTRGWTSDEIMNYEMHGTIPTRISGGVAANAPTMVGGC